MQRIPRIIYLTDTAEKIVHRLALKCPEGTIFRNTDGRPWTTESVNCAFVALQTRMGLEILKQEAFLLTEEEIQAKIATLQQERHVNGRTEKSRPPF